MPEYLDLEHLRATGPQPGEQLQPEDAPSTAPAAGAPAGVAPVAGMRARFGAFVWLRVGRLLRQTFLSVLGGLQKGCRDSAAYRAAYDLNGSF